MPNQGRRLALISEKRMFTVTVSSASVAIDDTVDRQGVLGYLRSAVHSMRRTHADIVHAPFDPRDTRWS